MRRAMEQLLQQAGLAVVAVGAARYARCCCSSPSVAGGARAVIAAERSPERAEVERAAQVRGLPITWPAETVDAAAVRAMSRAARPAQAVRIRGRAGRRRGGWRAV